MLRSQLVRAGLILLLATVIGCPAGGAAARPRVRPSPVRPCGTVRAAPRVWRHVVWILMENKSLGDVIGSPNAPYINRLARSCGTAANFHAEGHPSLPNYLALTSGSTQGVTDDGPPADHPLAAPSIFSQLGRDWQALAESMPSACALADAGLYAVRHNPVTYYTGIRPACRQRNLPLGRRPDLAPSFTFITPNVCHDMHACNVTGNDVGAQVRLGDAWLSRFLPLLLRTPEYASGSTAVFVVWDEPGTGTEAVPLLVISPATRPGTTAGASFDDYSLLRTTEEMLGLPDYLGAASRARSMRREFRL